MKPIKMWRVESFEEPVFRGTLAICVDDDEKLTSIFVRDGTDEKITTDLAGYYEEAGNIDTYKLFLDVHVSPSVTYKILSEIPISEGTEKVTMMVVSASVNPKAKAGA